MQYALDGTQPERRGNRDPHASPHGCFPCQGEDEWVAIACASDAEWQRLATHIDPALAADARFQTLAERKANEDALEAIVAAWSQERDRWRIASALQGMGIAAFPTFSCRDIVEDPHLNARGYIERPSASASRGPRPYRHPLAAVAATQRRAPSRRRV